MNSSALLHFISLHISLLCYLVRNNIYYTTHLNHQTLHNIFQNSSSQWVLGGDWLQTCYSKTTIIQNVYLIFDFNLIKSWLTSVNVAFLSFDSVLYKLKQLEHIVHRDMFPYEDFSLKRFSFHTGFHTSFVYLYHLAYYYISTIVLVAWWFWYCFI